MKMPFLLISPKIVPKIQLIKKGGCFEYHAVIADKIKYRYVHRASICPALGMDRRSFFMPKTMGKYKCILQLRGVRPFLSDKYDLTQHPNYKYTSDFDKRNEFNIEQFLSRRLKLKAGDEFVVVDAD